LLLAFAVCSAAVGTFVAALPSAALGANAGAADVLHRVRPVDLLRLRLRSGWCCMPMQAARMINSQRKIDGLASAGALVNLCIDIVAFRRY
jgi:D-serine deaminase-like pyridoxal phosphate-dependent protein